MLYGELMIGEKGFSERSFGASVLCIIHQKCAYIKNVLYTLSDKKIKMNSLEDLTEIKEIQLS